MISLKKKGFLFYIWMNCKTHTQIDIHNEKYPPRAGYGSTPLLSIERKRVVDYDTGNAIWNRATAHHRDSTIKIDAQDGVCRNEMERWIGVFGAAIELMEVIDLMQNISGPLELDPEDFLGYPKV
jgi:hypothetical protein